jgi:ComF family protein
MPNLVASLLELIYPNCCLACETALGSFQKLICINCQRELPHTEYHTYTSTSHPLEQYFIGRVELKHALAYLYFQKDSRVQRLMHALKYQGYPELGTLLGRWYASDLADAGLKNTFDLILPVPLHPLRLKRRGYNQSAGFAEALAEGLAAESRTDILVRKLAADSQTRKNRLQRWLNIEHSFSVVKPELLKNKHVAIADDVVTTGATLEACAQKLLAAGAASLSIIALATAR